MTVFLLFFLLVLFFPYLLLPLLLVLAVLLPFKFTITSLITLIYAPAQLFKIATNRKLRKNHALEHATINVIEEVYGPQRLSGLAREDGFFILGPVSPQLVEKAAWEALLRLRQGSADLVVHHRCGSSLVVGNLVGAVVFLFLLLYTGHLTLINVLFALLISSLIGPGMGRFSQRYFTTCAELHDMTIVGIRPDRKGGLFGFMGTTSNRIFIATREMGSP